MYSRECTAYTVSSFSRNNSYSAFKLVSAEGMLFLFQVLAETVLIPPIFDDFLIRKGILNILFGYICFKNYIVTLLRAIFCKSHPTCDSRVFRISPCFNQLKIKVILEYGRNFSFIRHSFNEHWIFSSSLSFFLWYKTIYLFNVNLLQVIGPKIQSFCKSKPREAVFVGKNL